jgi:ATP-dependent helicase/nuclease subunit A
VHESKGLEAPIVWLLDANTEKKNRDGNDVLLAWSPHEERPAHFSLYTDQASRGKKRAPLFEQDAAQQAREEMNLLYVAMTRAQQALIVSGNQGAKETKQLTWYGRIAAVVAVIPAKAGIQTIEEASQSETNPLVRLALRESSNQLDPRLRGNDEGGEILLSPILPTGQRTTRNTAQQQRGIWLHALLQHLAAHFSCPQTGAPKVGNPLPAKADAELSQGLGVRADIQRAVLQHCLSIPPQEMDALHQQAQHILTAPHLARFFDAQQYRNAYNEMPYINAKGELKRIDRMVEFDDEVWVMDYKLGGSEDAARYQAQMREYQVAMQSVFAGRVVRCALVFADGVLSEM